MRSKARCWELKINSFPCGGPYLHQSKEFVLVHCVHGLPGLVGVSAKSAIYLREGIPVA